MTAILAFGALALAAPASAQLVNGLNGPDYRHDAPIGTKGGRASLQAPGEAAAVAGALRNEIDAKNMGPTSGNLSIITPAARNQSIARNGEPSTHGAKRTFAQVIVALPNSG